MHHPKRIQQGFTLIELMVVLVIVAVLLSAAVVAINPNETAKLRQQTAAMQGLLTAMCDQAAFEQKLYLLMPDKNGLSIAKWSQQSWQASDHFKDKPWLSGIEPSWDLDAEKALQQNWPAPGWMCWPSGELMAGSIQFQLGDSRVALEWDEMMVFSQTAETP